MPARNNTANRKCPVFSACLLYRVVAIAIIISGISYSGFRYYLDRSAQYGMYLIGIKQYSVAMHTICPLHHKFPWHGNLSHACGLASLGANRMQSALNALINTKSYKFNYIVNVHLGLCYEKLGKWDEAIREYEYVIDYARKNDSAKQGLLRCSTYKLLGRLNTLPNPPDNQIIHDEDMLAESIYLKGYRHQNILEARSYIAYLQNKKKKLKELMENKNSTRIASQWLHLLSIREALSANNYASALEQSNDLLDAYGNSPYLLMRLFTELQGMVFEDPADHVASFHKVLGRLYYQGGNLPKAREELQKTLLLNPADSYVQQLLEEIESSR
jgi:tetratricopeptide (TPR) repeat protein